MKIIILNATLALLAICSEKCKSTRLKAMFSLKWYMITSTIVYTYHRIMGQKQKTPLYREFSRFYSKTLSRKM